MTGPDAAVFRWINGWPESLRGFMDFASNSLKETWFVVLVALYVVAMLAWNKKTRRAILLALVAFPLANEITDVLKDAIPWRRPFQEFPNEVFLRAGWSDSLGTASAHAANNAAVACVLTLCLGRAGWPWIAIALIVGISRIYNGVHWPTQVVLGWLCGAFAGFVVLKTWEAFERRRGGVQKKEDVEGTVLP